MSEQCNSLVERSQFQLMKVQQLFGAITAGAMWRGGDADLKEFLQKKHAKCVTSQMAEDSFQRQKRRTYTHSARKTSVRTPAL